MSLWPPRRVDQAKLDDPRAGAIPRGRSGRQTNSGPSGSELLVASEHVPDRVGEPPGDVDGRGFDLGSPVPCSGGRRWRRVHE